MRRVVISLQGALGGLHVGFIFHLEMHVCYPYLKMQKAFKTLQSGCHWAWPDSRVWCQFPYSHHKNG